MDSALPHLIIFLGVAICVAILARRLRLPYTVGLVMVGVGLALSGLETGALLTHDFIFEIILPPLLFEAALSLSWDGLKRDLFPILLLSTFGVGVSVGVTAAGLMALLHWPLVSAVCFGVLIAATDPIAVLAMFKDVGIKGRLRLLVESESLFNDGTAAVLFALVLVWIRANGASVGAGEAALLLAQMAGGGLLVGAACGLAALVLAGRASDHLVETAVTSVAAYGSFLLAEYLHGSGVLACVAAGMVLGNFGLVRDDEEESAFSLTARQFVLEMWEFAAFIANSLIFLLIGLRVASISFSTLGWGALALIVSLVLVARALTVYPLCAVFAASRWRIGWAEQHVLWWGGLRGALALALVLSLPESVALHDEILEAAFAVVAFSVVVQGVTMPLLLRRLRLVNG